MRTATYDIPADGHALAEGYTLRRRSDPRIASTLLAALGDARSVLNVGAGAGSYEPGDRTVLALDPSELMIRQRPAGAAPSLRGVAESLPFSDNAFDAAMAVLTIHHWTDWRLGLSEMLRVARRRVVVLAFEVEASDFWLTRDYFPAIIDHDRRIMPSLSDINRHAGAFRTAPLLVPHDCHDGFLGAHWRRPAAYLDPNVRKSMSSFAKFDARKELALLASDLESGVWRARHADLLDREALDIGLRLLRWEIDPD